MKHIMNVDEAYSFNAERQVEEETNGSSNGKRKYPEER